MLHLLIVALTLLAATGCAPALIHVAPPALPSQATFGPTVSIDYPVDDRPAGERRDGGFYDSTLALPFLTYGDANLRPAPIDAVDLAVRTGLASRGIPVVPDHADYRVRVFVLHHDGTQDVSDAQWVSTLTGGVAGTVGKFFYPIYCVVDARLRIEVLDAEGRPVAVRDVASYVVRKKVYALTWGIFYLFKHDVVAELFEDAFEQAHTELAITTAAIVDQVRQGEPVTAGAPPEEPAQHTLSREWRRADTFELRQAGFDDPHVLAKYGTSRFSLWTGHDTERGEVVGHVGLPVDTFGYDIGVLDDLQVQADVTVLGLYNSLEGGVRWRAYQAGPVQMALFGHGGTKLVVLPENHYVPELAAVDAGGDVLVSTRPHEITWFASAGASYAHVYHEYQRKGFEELAVGPLYSVTGGAGVEVQITPTALIGARLDATANFQGGDALHLGNLGAVVPVPSLVLGLR